MASGIDAGIETICFSTIAILRCQGLSKGEIIATFVPSAVEILLVPTVLAVAWTRPRSTLILLAIELVLYSGLATWDLTIHLSPPTQGSFETEDTALAITSSLPLLFFLLFLTAHLLTDVRPHLPSAFRSTPSAHAFSILIAPLVPIAFVGGLLPSFLLLVYNTTPTSLNGATLISFATPSDENLHQILSDAGAVAAATYTLFVVLLTLLMLIRPTSSKSLTESSAGGFPPKWARSIVALALLLAGSEIALTVIPPPLGGFVVIILRKAVRLSSRFLVVIGLVGMYRPQRAGGDEREGFEIIPPASKLRDTISTFGTPPPSLKVDKTAKSQGSKAKGRPKPLRLQIGAPVEASFRKMDTSATREFYALHSARMRGTGMGENVGRVAGDGAPVAPIGRVVFRTPAARAPILSFTSSIFDSSALEGLARAIRPQSSSPTRFIVEPRTAFSTTTTTVGGLTKKYTGSIYAPSRVSVEESMLSQWPPAAPLSLTGNGRGVGGREGAGVGAAGRAMMSIAVVGTVVSGQLGPPYRSIGNQIPRSMLPRQADDQPTESERYVGRPTIIHPYQYQSPAISRNPSESSTMEGEYAESSHHALARERRSSAVERVTVGTAPHHRMTDALLTPVNALPRVNSVRRKPVPDIDDLRTAGALGGIGVSQYFTSGAVSSAAPTLTNIPLVGDGRNADRRRISSAQKTTPRPTPPPPHRRSTDPTLALLSASPPRTHSPKESRLRSSTFTLASTATATAAINPSLPSHDISKSKDSNTAMSPTSDYSQTLASPVAADVTVRIEKDDVNLFFHTPVQSPSEEDHSFPPHTDSSGRTFKVLSYFATATAGDENPIGGESRRAILASLSRLQKDAGIEPDLSRLRDESEGEDDYDSQSVKGEERLRYSVSTFDSEDLTPRAEVGPVRMRKDYGGVI